jgi:hypothetical protein
MKPKSKLKPWDKPQPNARKCKHCGSQRPGMQPLTLFIDGKPVRGYWHLECFEIARKAARK